MEPTPIEISRDSRTAVIAQVRQLSPYCDDDDHVSPIRGGLGPARESLTAIEPEAYGSSRNHIGGAVTRLSPYLRHGVVSAASVRDVALSHADGRKSAEKFVQQLTWRDYWHRLYKSLGDDIWTDLEDYKTGFSASDYADDLPEDIAAAETGVASIDHFLRDLIQTGYIHNHARLYVAGYVCHFRRVKWQAGARFFLTHLLDGDPASNNLSWQWVASTFSHKPYFFNLENVQTFSPDAVDTSYQNNKAIAGSYEDIHARLFPLLPPRETSDTAQRSKRSRRSGRRRS